MDSSCQALLQYTCNAYHFRGSAMVFDHVTDAIPFCLLVFVITSLTSFIDSGPDNDPQVVNTLRLWRIVIRKKVGYIPGWPRYERPWPTILVVSYLRIKSRLMRSSFSMIISNIFSPVQSKGEFWLSTALEL